MELDVKARTICMILKITKLDFEDLIESNSKLKKSVLVYNTKLLNSGARIPLDYIRRTSSPCIRRGLSEKKFHSLLSRRIIFKNLVFRIVLKIREHKNRPKLGQIMQLIRQKTTQEAEQKVILMKHMVTKLYCKRESKKHHIT